MGTVNSSTKSLAVAARPTISPMVGASAASTVPAASNPRLTNIDRRNPNSSASRLSSTVPVEDVRRNALRTHEIAEGDAPRFCCSSGSAGTTSDCNIENDSTATNSAGKARRDVFVRAAKRVSVIGVRFR